MKFNAFKFQFNRMVFIYVLLAIIIYLCSPFINPIQSELDQWMMRRHQQIGLKTPIRILYFDENDINQLGGWPLPRNVYAYLADQLGQLGAKAIGFDIFWGDSYTTGNENDNLLESILVKGYPIVGSYYFEDFQLEKLDYWKQLFDWNRTAKGIIQGKNLALPSGSFLYSGVDFGFINVPLESNGIVKHSVLQADLGDTTLPSFAMAIASQYLGSSLEEDVFRINYQVPLDKMDFIPISTLNASIGTDSLRALFHDSIVLIGVVSSQFGFNRATPVHSNLPVVAIHAHIIENLVQQSYLQDFPAWASLVCLLLIAFFALYLRRFRLWIHIVAFIGLSICLLGAMFVFWKIYIVFPFSLMQIGIVIFWLSGLVSTLVFQHGQVNFEIARREKLEIAFSQKIHQASQLEREYIDLRKKYQEEIQNIREVLDHMPPEEKNRLKDIFPEIVCSTGGSMMQVLSEMNRLAKTDEPVFITGETGTGKDLVAKGIYLQSNRFDKEYIPINCGALSEQLLESELFGHEKGAFTGAAKAKAGFFEAADQGTIFLDEISETSLSFQAKLLRILQEGTFFRVGSTVPKQVNVRIIAATNRDLHDSIQRGDFRQDLYYRLNVLPIHLPPLRERQSDISILLFHFLGEKDLQISQEAIKFLQAYHWPGNIRELQNVSARLRVLPNGSLVTPQWLKRQGGLQKSDQEISVELDDQILQLYREFDFQNSSNVKIAEQLGHMHRSTITEYLKGMTFLFFFEEDYDIDRTVARFNPNSDEAKDGRIKSRIRKYLANHIAKLDTKEDLENNLTHIQESIRKVPQKYHDVIYHVSKAYLQGMWHF